MLDNDLKESRDIPASGTDVPALSIDRASHPLQLYLKEIGLPQESASQVTDLSGDKSKITDMIEAQIHLVLKIIDEYKNKWLSKCELFSAGNEWLFSAVTAGRWRNENKIKEWVRGAIEKALLAEWRVVGIEKNTPCDDHTNTIYKEFQRYVWVDAMHKKFQKQLLGSIFKDKTIPFDPIGKDKVYEQIKNTCDIFEIFQEVMDNLQAAFWNYEEYPEYTFEPTYGEIAREFMEILHEKGIYLYEAISNKLSAELRYKAVSGIARKIIIEIQKLEHRDTVSPCDISELENPLDIGIHSTQAPDSLLVRMSSRKEFHKLLFSILQTGSNVTDHDTSKMETIKDYLGFGIGNFDTQRLVKKYGIPEHAIQRIKEQWLRRLDIWRRQENLRKSNRSRFNALIAEPLSIATDLEEWAGTNFVTHATFDPDLLTTPTKK